MLDAANRAYAQHYQLQAGRLFIASVVHVRQEELAAGRPRQLVTAIEWEHRTCINNAIVLSWEGRSWIANAASLQPTTRNLVTGTIYSFNPTTRAHQMADGFEPPEGWDGDEVLILMAGRQAIVIGCVRHAAAASDVTKGGVDNPLDAAYIASATTLAESAWVSGDELPVMTRTSSPDAKPGRFGRVLWTTWTNDGMVLEVRAALGGTVAARAALHVEATETRLLARGPTVRLEAGQDGASGWERSNRLELVDGTGLVGTLEEAVLDLDDGTQQKHGLKVSLDVPSETDLQAIYQSTVRHPPAKVVIDLLRAQLNDTQTQLNAAIAAINQLQTETAALKVATAAIVMTPAGVLTNAVAAVPVTVNPCSPSNTQGPTDADVTAMRSTTVKVGA